MANKAKIGISVIATAMVLSAPFIIDREDEKLESYRDAVGVYTICSGETFGVSPGEKLTKEHCRLLTQSRIGMFMFQIVEMIEVPLSPETLAAHTSFAYNIGIEGYRRSTTLRLTNEGKIREGCEAMKLWHKAGGRDCRTRWNGCYGLWQRRLDEVKLCLSGVK